MSWVGLTEAYPEMKIHVQNDLMERVPRKNKLGNVEEKEAKQRWQAPGG